MKHNSRLCAHVVIQQWGVECWENYAPVVNWISVRLLLSLASIHKLPSISIDFVLDFPKSYLDVDVFLDIPLGMGVGRNKL